MIPTKATPASATIERTPTRILDPDRARRVRDGLLRDLTTYGTAGGTEADARAVFLSRVDPTLAYVWDEPRPPPFPAEGLLIQLLDAAVKAGALRGEEAVALVEPLGNEPSRASLLAALDDFTATYLVGLPEHDALTARAHALREQIEQAVLLVGMTPPRAPCDTAPDSEPPAPESGGGDGALEPGGGGR